MDTTISRRIRVGAMALGTSALLFVLFPLVRPFFAWAGENSPAQMAVAAQAYVSAQWVIAHLLAMSALVLLPFGMLALHAFLVGGSSERRAFGGMLFGLGGVALILPTLGVETYALPIFARAYLDGKADLQSSLLALYSGPDNMVMIVGLLLLAIGGIMIASAVWTSATLPKWSGVILAAGLLLWFPLLPQAVRITDGVLIAIGGLWLAWSVGSKAVGLSYGAALASSADTA